MSADLTVERLAHVIGPRLAPVVFSAAEPAFREFGIGTALQRAHFLAQAAHETGGFVRTVESFAYSAERALAVFPRHFRDLADAQAVVARGQAAIAERVYGGRMGNRPEGSGDGYRYRGRGWFHLTGSANYAIATAALRLPLLENPDLAAEHERAARIAGDYWRRRRCGPLAETDNIEAITRRINGGLNGIDDRRAWLVRFKRAMGLST